MVIETSNTLLSTPSPMVNAVSLIICTFIIRCLMPNSSSKQACSFSDFALSCYFNSMFILLALDNAEHSASVSYISWAIRHL